MPETTEPYRAFLSYSTEPDYQLARYVEVYLESFHLRPGIRRLQLDKLEICFDGSDFRLPEKRSASAQPGEAMVRILDEYLAQASYLAVLCSRNAVASLYVAHEVRYFLDHGRTDRILLLITEGADPSTQPGDIIPGPVLDAGLHVSPWYDLRGKRLRANPVWKRVRNFDDELARLAADLHGEAAGRIYPTWQRQRERVRRFQKFVVTVAVLLTVAALAWWAWSRTDTYQESRLLAEVQNGRRLHELSGWLAENGRIDEGLRAARSATNSDDRNNALLDVAEVLHKMGHTAEAGKAYIDALALEGDRVWPQSLAGAILTVGFTPKVKKILQSGENTLLDSASSQLLNSGRKAEALHVARAIRLHEDLTSRSRALARIAEKLAPADARPILEEALKDAGEFTDREEISRGYLLLGDFERAWQIADSETVELGRKDTFSALAEWAAGHGDLPRARQAIERLIGIDAARGSSAPWFVIRSLLRNGQTEQALNLARVPNPDIEARVSSFIDIARELHEFGKTGQALSVLNEVRPACGTGQDSLDVLLLLDIAEALAANGDRFQGVRIQDQLAASTIKAQQWTTVALVAESMAKLGRASDAQSLVGHLESKIEIRDVLGKVASGLAEAGQSAAIEIGRRVPYTSGSCVALAAIFAEVARVEETRAAVQCAADQDSMVQLLQTAADLSREGKTAGAASILAAVPSVPGRTDVELVRARAVKDLALALARQGQIAEARARTSELASGPRAVTLAEIAESARDPIERAGIAGQAVHTEGLDDPSLEAVATHLTKAGEFGLALEATRRIARDNLRRGLPIRIAIGLARFGLLGQARHVIVTYVPDEEARINASVAVLKAWRGEMRGDKRRVPQ
jgi:hypothetical protein